MKSKRQVTKLNLDLVLLSFLTLLFGIVYLITGLFSKYQNLKLADSTTAYIITPNIPNFSNPANIRIESKS